MIWYFIISLTCLDIFLKIFFWNYKSFQKKILNISFEYAVNKGFIYGLAKNLSVNINKIINLSAVFSLMIIYYYTNDRYILMMIIPAFGNCLGRLLHGCVIDYLNIIITINISDILIISTMIFKILEETQICIFFTK